MIEKKKESNDQTRHEENKILSKRPNKFDELFTLIERICTSHQSKNCVYFVFVSCADFTLVLRTQKYICVQTEIDHIRSTERIDGRYETVWYTKEQKRERKREKQQ